MLKQTEIFACADANAQVMGADDIFEASNYI